MVCSPCTALLPADKEMSRDAMIRLHLQETGPGKNSVSVEIHEQATVQNLISAYCAKRGVSYSSALVISNAKKNSLPHFRTLQSLGLSDGQSLYVGYEKKSSSLDKKWIFILTVIVMAVFIAAIIIMSSVYATSGGIIPFDFGVVMDGGSSKTNVLLYKWAGDKHRGTGCVQQPYPGCKAKGGIAKNNASYVLDCVNEVKGRIKPSSVSSSPLYFVSTAGMRLLRISSPEKVKAKLEEITTVLNSTGMDLKEVAIISGHDEGKYDWITANFLKDTLEKEPEQNPWRPATVGALDMGGASTQISFAIEPTVNNSDPSVEIVKLFGQEHHVFASSSLCFGRGEAENRHRSFLVKNPTSLTGITDPCTPKGYRYEVLWKKLFGEPCANSTLSSEWIKDNPKLEDENVTFIGTGDFQDCSKAAKRVVDADDCQKKGLLECFTKITEPLDNQKFLAFASYSYTMTGLNLTKSSFSQFINGTKEYCSLSEDELDKGNPFAPDYCFNACYMHEILVTGYGFTNETWSNIEFLDKIGDKEISWPLGYMIKATNIIPEKKPSPKFTSVGVFAVCMVIFIFIVIVAAVFLAYNFGTKHSDQYSLQYA